MAGRGDRFAASVLSFGVFLPAALAVGAGLGWLGDRFFGTFPVLTALGALGGFAAGIRQLLREATALAGPPPPDPPAPPPPGAKNP